jgi:hypothetical protein
MQVIRRDSQYTQVEVEVNGVGNVDDVILRSPHGDRFGQVKWATQTAARVDEDFLTDAEGKGKSVLQKLYGAYRKVTIAGGPPPTLELITNRGLDRDHSLLGHVDGRTDLLLPYAAAAPPKSPAALAVQGWADHIGCTRDELLAMLARLRLRTGLTVSAEREHVLALMDAAGLEATEENLQRGLDIVAGWVEGGKRIITGSEVSTVVNEHDLHRVDPANILLIQAIDRDPNPEDATVTLDWVDLFDGADARQRVQPRDPASWAVMDAELQDAAGRIEDTATRTTLVRGALRQATFFRAGTVLPGVRQHTLRYHQGDQIWATNATKAPIPQPGVERVPIDCGAELSVAVGITRDPTTAVTAYVREAGLPVRHILTISPWGGPDDQVVANAGQAVAYAQRIRELVRDEVESAQRIDRLHLFLAGPGGLALLLGHRWNRMPTTLVYEHLGPGRGYTHAFTVES